MNTDLLEGNQKEYSIDIRGEQCPRTFIRSKLVLEKIEIGSILNILLDNKIALENLPRAFMYQGQEYIETKTVSDSEWVIRIRRKR